LTLDGRELEQMDCRQALQWITGLAAFGYQFGLTRIGELMTELGNPHHCLPVVHIGGTNGKGSTAAMIASMLSEAGYRVGLFTSPHLHHYLERTRIGSRHIPAEQFARLASRVRAACTAITARGGEHPTEFEVNTAISLLYFTMEEVDLAVIEVGLGGAIDSTNIIANSLVSVITNVGMDHMEYLGNTIEEIALVKAGIIKQGGRVVTAAERPEALAVIRQVSAAQGATVWQVGKDIVWEEVRFHRQGIGLNLYSRQKSYPRLNIPLLGRHQVYNAATAVLAVEILGGAGYPVPDQAVAGGLAKTRWPGRMEIIQGNPPVVLDVAHNPDGAAALRQAMADHFPGVWPQRTVLLLGILADKDRQGVVDILLPGLQGVVVTRPPSTRAGDWRQVAAMAAAHCPQVLQVEDIGQGLVQAREMVGPDGLLCVTGSFYTVGAVRKELLKDGASPVEL